ncbi:ornithine cyclodeaminase family protein [Pelomonas aquatica]|jgi:ornithine cyclodeaminase|uniref:Ornithine cyclodeaminase family protein n=1 Tax=Pelomonas aquatica TaxID=431058 RepID=A0A9X4R8T7_9BURK|nr:ornithine cyclodeaminase family protein [Pelomonas aquatica]MCY4756535.1 ornithine cyclodeaminase family protein [Pelomonas aquatica]MDG0863563.1 ornithine cyclodeaminase family protein [Pelomonas aquatica]
MRLITEAEVAAVLDPDSAVAALRAAFAQHGRGRAQVLGRHRATATQDGAALAISAMGAILDADAAADGGLPAVLGTKVYSARNGRYHFLVSLFSAATGAPIATLEANEFTRLRTAAATAVAADLLARPDARTLAVFGAGIQARAHAEALYRVRRFERVLVCARSGADALARELQAALGLTVRSAAVAEAAAEADVIVTATRSATPLFDGGLVKAGAFVAAVGTSTPTARELDDALLGRASLVAVEWLGAARHEAGELVLAAPGVVPAERLVELGALLVEPRPRGPLDIVVYKSVGIGLEDVALARLVARRLGLC